MTEKKNKRSLMTNISMIIRGYKIIFKLFPRYLFWNTLSNVWNHLTPYFGLFMSSLILNELVGDCDGRVLARLAAITVTGTFIIGLLGRLIGGRSDVNSAGLWRCDLLYFLERQCNMQYDHIEDPEVVILREKIQTMKNATGAGLMKLLWQFSYIVGVIVKIVASVVLTVSMFSMMSDKSYTGFLGFINSPYSFIVIVVLIFFNAFLAIWSKNSEERQVAAIHAETAKINAMFGRLANTYGADSAVFNAKRIVLPEYAKLLIKPEYLRRSVKVQTKHRTARLLGSHFLAVALDIFMAAKVFVGAFGIGSFWLYRGTVEKFIAGVADLAGIIGVLFQNNDALEEVFKFLDLPDDMYRGTLSVEKRDDIEYEIEFRDVSFKYPRSDVWVLRHVSTKFKIGSQLAIVGMNGSGKTTFIKLLCRLYDPTEGQILLNGIDITRYKYEEYMQIFSVVFQDFKLFSFSIAENVAGSLDYDRERVLDCLERAGLGARIAELERGIETPIFRNFENDGIDISGGEAQKLAIARALYKGAPFIILDEPTAALDPLAEAEVYNQFNLIVENKTAIYISHRLSSCRFCENILVFHNGEIVQSGSHDTLVADEKGKYHELWHAQAQYYV